MWVSDDTGRELDADLAHEQTMEEAATSQLGLFAAYAPQFASPFTPEFLHGSIQHSILNHPPPPPVSLLVSQTQAHPSIMGRSVVTMPGGSAEFVQQRSVSGSEGSHICSRIPGSYCCAQGRRLGDILDEQYMQSQFPPTSIPNATFLANPGYYDPSHHQAAVSSHALVFPSQEEASGSARPIRLVENPSFCVQHSSCSKQPETGAVGSSSSRSRAAPPGVHRQKRSAVREPSVEPRGSGSSDDDSKDDQSNTAGRVEVGESSSGLRQSDRRRTKAVKVPKIEVCEPSETRLSNQQPMLDSPPNQSLIDLTVHGESDEDDILVIGAKRRNSHREESPDEDQDNEFIDPITPVVPEIVQGRAERIRADERSPSVAEVTQSFPFDGTQQLHREPIASPRSAEDCVGHQNPAVHHHCCSGSAAAPSAPCPHATCTCHHPGTCATCFNAARHYHHYHHYHHHLGAHQGMSALNLSPSAPAPTCQLHSPCPTHCPYGTDQNPSVVVPEPSRLPVRHDQPQQIHPEHSIHQPQERLPVLVSGQQEVGVPPRMPHQVTRPRAASTSSDLRNLPYAPPSGIRRPQATGRQTAHGAGRQAAMSSHHRNLLEQQNAQAERGRQALNPWFERQRVRTRHAAGAFYSQPAAYGYYGMMPVTGGWPDTRGGIIPTVPQSTQQQFHNATAGLPVSVLAHPHVTAAYQRPDSPAYINNPLFRVPAAAPRHARRPVSSAGHPVVTSSLFQAAGAAMGMNDANPAGYLLVSPSGQAVATPTAQIVQAAAAAASAAVAQAAHVVPMMPPQHPVIGPPIADFGTLAVGPFYFGTGDIGLVGGPTFTVAGTAEPQPVGVTQHMIEQCTEMTTYRKPSDQVPEGEEDRCTVCLSEFEIEERIRTLRCAHIFHTECIDRWLVLNKKCPICRVEVDRGCAAAGEALTAQRVVAQSPEVMITFETRNRPFHTRMGNLPIPQLVNDRVTATRLGVQTFNPMSFAGAQGMEGEWQEQ